MKEIQFNKYRKASFFFSGALFLLSIILIAFKGFNLSIDFTGGMVIEFAQSGEEVTAPQTREVLKALKLDDYSVQMTENKVTIIKVGVKPSENKDLSVFTGLIKNAISQKFTKTDINFLKIDFVSPQIGKELTFKAIIAVLVSLIGVLLYVSVRFELRYSLGAILALIHDIFITLGFISLVSLSFDVSTIAAVLTVVGYSINDSVVVFDRIREIFKLNPKMKNESAVQHSLNVMLSRTIITSFTTLIAILSIILIGGEILRPFASIMFFGIIIGTFSSIFIAPCFLHARKSS
jgi:preprotein translocase subunit SecF